MGLAKKKQLELFGEKKPRGRPPKIRTITVTKSMDFLRKVDQLKLDGNIAEHWRIFKQNFDLFYTAAEINKKPNEVQAAIFLNAVGPEAVELFNSFSLSQDQRKSYKDIVEAFEAFCKPKKNLVYASYMFYIRNQQPMEPFDNFLMDLKKLIKMCEFAEESRMLRDRIVLGVADKTLQKKLLETDDLDVNKAINLARAAEASKQQAAEIQKPRSSQYQSLDAVMQRPTGTSGGEGKHKVYRSNVSKVNSNRNFNNTVKNFRNDRINYRQEYEGKHIKNCKFCLHQHPVRKCPAWGKVCNKCGKKNHFATACQKTEVCSIKQVMDTLFIDSIKNFEENINESSWYKKVSVGNKIIEFKLDTGAQCNVIPEKIFSTIRGAKYETSQMTLEAYGGTKIHAKGVALLQCRAGNISSNIKFVIVDIDAKPILGLSACIGLKLITRIDQISLQDKEQFIKKYSKAFEGLGKFPTEYKIELKKNAQPVVRPARKVPLSLMEPLKNHLELLCERKIIEKVREPVEWVSNLVIVEKKNKELRLCLDPKYLNEAILDETYPIPSFEEISAKLTEMKYFTVLDLKEGYWQVCLDHESSRLCNCSTPYGCYRFNRLPFGIKTAPQAFQKLNQQNFSNIPGVIMYIDDILVGGRTYEEHDKNLALVMERAIQNNIKFNKEKIQFRVSKVSYLGHIISSEGIRYDPVHMKAIQDLKAPTNKTELQKMLGMINYLRKFIPNLAELSHPLRELLKKNVVFQWQAVHDSCLNEIKENIIRAPNLTPFNPSKEVTIQADASKFGLGCCLMQEGKPVSFASRSLIPAEINYAQVEKELLAIVFSCEKFHKYIYGRKVTVITDHKPLLGIMQKEIGTIPSPRLQRMKLRLMKYNLSLRYSPGKDLVLADLLSRNYSEDACEPEIKDIEEMVHTLNISPEKRELFKQETKNDIVLRNLIEVLKTGWPESKNKVPDNIRYLWKFKNELFIEDGLVFFRDRIFVPVSLRDYVLGRLHESHLGIEKTKARARSLVFWPGMNETIENRITKCTVCQRYRQGSVREPMIAHTIPDIPYYKIGMDIMEFRGKLYLIVADYFSKYVDVMKLNRKTAEEVIGKLKILFSTHGIPRIIIGDNNPFGSYKLRQFAQELDITLITSSPHYAQSNGFAEKYVQTIKLLMTKAVDSKTEFWKTLLEYRNTPIKGMDVSPAELLLGRKTRTLIPGKESLFRKHSHEQVHKQICKNSDRNKQYYDRKSRYKNSFVVGDNVWYNNGSGWVEAKIIDRDRAPRSYWIELENGVKLRRNSKVLRKKR